VFEGTFQIRQAARVNAAFSFSAALAQEGKMLARPEARSRGDAAQVSLVGSSSHAAACLPNARRAVRPVKLLLHPL
jgi:hypothetical protein